MMKIATVKVPMSDFCVDILVGGSKYESDTLHKKRYGLSMEYCDGNTQNECATISSGIESELKGEIRFRLNLEVHPKQNINVFIHELWHLMWNISRTITDFKLNQDTQSWAANMVEELAESIINAHYIPIYPLKKK